MTMKLRKRDVAQGMRSQTTGTTIHGTPHDGPKHEFIGVFDLFRIGIGPSSSHTVGPMRAARDFLSWCAQQPRSGAGGRVVCDLFGSLALTGVGHATDVAVMLGLAGEAPETVDPDAVPGIVADLKSKKGIPFNGRFLNFDPNADIQFRKREFLKAHPNALRFSLLQGEKSVLTRTYYSVGGGFIEIDGAVAATVSEYRTVPFAFDTAARLLEVADRAGLSIAGIARANEVAVHGESALDAGLHRVWEAMRACVDRGLRGEGVLPGGLLVKRRARALHESLLARDQTDQGDALRAMEWVNLFALAVNEENAAGGRVVTAPTNGAAGIIPAVLHYYDRFVTGASFEGIETFLLTAAAIGAIIKRNASISGADVGCQGEVGSAAAMAAAGLAAVLGGTNAQVENAAEIALEHSLGLTCDPVGGLVQIPCIERNAMAAIKAINAARLTLHSDGKHRVTLDQAIETMRQTGRDMKRKYKETSKGGLAVNVPLC